MVQAPGRAALGAGPSTPPADGCGARKTIFRFDFQKVSSGMLTAREATVHAAGLGGSRARKMACRVTQTCSTARKQRLHGVQTTWTVSLLHIKECLVLASGWETVYLAGTLTHCLSY